MPAPVVVPLAVGLGSVLGSGFAGLVVWLTGVIGKKAAVATALGTFLVAGWVALQLSILGMWLALAWSVPTELEIPLGFLRYVLPGNTEICMEAVILSKIGRWLWDGQRDWARAA
jgi:hypothetical protein